MLWSSQHSQSTPCAISPSGVQLTVPASAIWPRTASGAMSAELSNILKLTTRSLPQTVAHTVESVFKLIREKKGKKRKSSWEIHGVVGATNSSSVPNNNQVLKSKGTS